MLASQLQFINGRAEIKQGRKVLARIYDRAVYYAANNIKSGFSAATPFELNIAGIGARECASLEEAVGFLNKYVA